MPETTATGPPLADIFGGQNENCNAVPKGATAHLGSDEIVKYAPFQQLIPDVLHAILKCPKNGGCAELTKKDS